MWEDSEQSKSHGGLSSLGSWKLLGQDEEQQQYPGGLIPRISKFRDLEKLPLFYQHILSTFCMQGLYPEMGILW